MSHRRAQSISGRLAAHPTDKELQRLLLSAALDVSGPLSQAIGFRLQEVVRDRGLAISRSDIEKLCPSCGNQLTRDSYARISIMRKHKLGEGFIASTSSRTLTANRVGLLRKCNVCQRMHTRCFKNKGLAVEAAKKEGLMLRGGKEGVDKQKVGTSGHMSGAFEAVSAVEGILPCSHQPSSGNPEPRLRPFTILPDEICGGGGGTSLESTIAKRGPEEVLQAGPAENLCLGEACGPSISLPTIPVERCSQQPCAAFIEEAVGASMESDATSGCQSRSAEGCSRHSSCGCLRPLLNKSVRFFLSWSESMGYFTLWGNRSRGRIPACCMC
eukprot:jgi/Botrbrau1/17836/Bobra.0127s0079.1